MVVRPTMPETTALGAAMAAGMAKGVNVWTFNPEDKSQINTDVFEPAIDPHGKINWNTVLVHVSLRRGDHRGIKSIFKHRYQNLCGSPCWHLVPSSIV